ncbi:MAG TPA: MFS transporter [Bacillota bacterium]|nr:MFS transporter [Bacillota bacterium]
MTREGTQSQKWPIILFTIGVFMAGLDNGIISTALTTIYESFNVSPAWGAWSITLYTLGIAISVPIIGKLSDNYGRKRLFIIEVALFGIGSLLVALSPNFTFLLIARFIQAIGGGGIFIIGSSHVLATLPKDKQGKALGLLGSMHGLSAVLGPNIGAVILHVTDSWHWLFLINIPIALLLIAFGIVKIEETKAPTGKRLDMVGSLLLSVSILTFMLGMTRLADASLTDLVTISLIGLSIVFAALFLFYEKSLERSGGDPIIAYTMLRSRLFQTTVALGLLSGGFLAGIIYIPSFVQHVLGVAVSSAGFWLTPLALSSGIGAGLGGFLTDRFGARRTVIAAGIIGAIGFFAFKFFVTNLLIFTLASIVAGLGLGILLGAPLNVLVGESASDNGKGAALGTLSLSRQIGLTVFPTIYASFLTVAQTTSAGYDKMFLTSGGASLIVIILGVYLLMKEKRKRL